MDENRLGASLFCSPHIESTCLSFSHVSSPLWHWDICETSSVVCPNYQGHAEEGHEPLVDVSFPDGSSLPSSLAAHLSYLEGSFFVNF